MHLAFHRPAEGPSDAAVSGRGSVFRRSDNASLSTRWSIWRVAGRQVNDCFWRNLRLQPKSAFSYLPLVHWADLRGQERVYSGRLPTGLKGTKRKIRTTS